MVPDYSTYIAWAYLVLVVSYIFVAHWMVKRPYKLAWLRKAILRQDPRGKHIVVHYAILVALCYLLIQMYWFPVAVVVIVDAFVWIYLWGYILPVLRMQQQATELLKTDPNITAASRNEMVMRRP
jgi:hypothetical protein